MSERTDSFGKTIGEMWSVAKRSMGCRLAAAILVLIPSTGLCWTIPNQGTACVCTDNNQPMICTVPNSNPTVYCSGLLLWTMLSTTTYDHCDPVAATESGGFPICKVVTSPAQKKSNECCGICEACPSGSPVNCQNTCTTRQTGGAECK